VTLAIDVPVLTNVSVEQTSAEAGEVYVRWTSPLEIDPAQFPPPYTYELLRGTGFGGGELTSLTTTTDTVFTDTGLNTEGTPYYYVVRLYDGNGQEAGDSPPASSVWLEASSLLGAIELSWSAEVPWNNNVQGYPYHRIYRTDGSGGPLELIDSVNVNLSGFFYRDEGQYNGVALSDTREYCYFVETSGSYGNPLLMEPLLNKSQVACAQPNDTVPPCAPPGLGFELGGLEDCQDFFAELRWSVDAASGCDGDIRTYRVYYSRTGEEGSFEVVSPDNLSDTVFVHGGLPSFAGCYKVTAVDRSGNESAFTETVCRENCPSYVLPNIITPNGDGKNDVFRPFDCPQFVLSVSFRVYNRWGKEVYSYQSDGGENSIYINWEGRDSSGSELSSGVYYYVADVTFDVLEPAGAQQALKGWVHVVR
jgi:gliding motility-associated-like protein